MSAYHSDPSETDVLDPLLNGAVKWSTSTVTYALTSNVSEMTNHTPPRGGTYGQFLNTDHYYAKLQSIIKLWDDLVAATITETLDVANADIHIGRISNNDGSSYGGTPYSKDSGDFWLNSGIQGNSPLAPFNSADWAIGIHEFGHVMGLAHGGYYDVANNATVEPDNYQDTYVYSIMSYFGPTNGMTVPTAKPVQPANWWAGTEPYYPQTPMMNDITAINTLYGGLDPTTRREDSTVYGFDSNIVGDLASVYKFITAADTGIGNKTPILCIYDAGGVNDVLSLSGWSTSSAISLIPGTFSNANGMTMNISIARETVIENAIGGGGADIIVGNDADNDLAGGDGDDILMGGIGSDTLRGGRGNDILDGSFRGTPDRALSSQLMTAQQVALWDQHAEVSGPSFGIDTAHYGGRGNEGIGATGIYVNMTLPTEQVTNDGYGNKDTLIDIERIVGSAGNDIVIVGGTLRYLEGGGVAAGGTDVVSFVASTAAVQINMNEKFQAGGLAQDFALTDIQGAEGSIHNDVIRLKDTGLTRGWGHDGHDTIYGGLGESIADGGTGNDVYAHRGGTSKFNGGTGTNELNLSLTNDGFLFDLPNGKVRKIGNPANAADDVVFTDVQKFVGSQGNDTFKYKAGVLAYDGVGGVDTIDFTSAGGGVVVNLSAGLATRNGQNIAGFSNIENAIGTSGQDAFIGNAAANTFTGGNSDDIFQGRGGADTFYGGAGIDRASYIDSAQGVTIDLRQAVQHGGDAEGDTYDSIEGAWGSESADLLIGNQTAGAFNWFAGGGGNDEIHLGIGTGHTHGGAGNDVIVHHGGGQDIWGNADADAFYFDSTSFSSAGIRTSIHDFEKGIDSIVFRNGVSASDITVEASGGDAKIVVGNYGHIFLDNAANLGLTAGDFFYV